MCLKLVKKKKNFCLTEGTSESTEIDLTNLANRVWESIKKRECVEKRHSSVEDDGLVGMLSFMCNLLKYDNTFKFSKLGMEALDQVCIEVSYIVTDGPVENTKLVVFVVDIRIFIRVAGRDEETCSEM